MAITIDSLSGETLWRLVRFAEAYQHEQDSPKIAYGEYLDRRTSPTV